MKIIKIESCSECPLLAFKNPEDGGEPYCMKSCILRTIDGIPSWCPLPDVQEDAETTNTITITKCIECGSWIPADSHGTGTYCDELQRIVSDDIEMIPDCCPKLTTQQGG